MAAHHVEIVLMLVPHVVVGTLQPTTLNTDRTKVRSKAPHLSSCTRRHRSDHVAWCDPSNTNVEEAPKKGGTYSFGRQHRQQLQQQRARVFASRVQQLVRRERLGVAHFLPCKTKQKIPQEKKRKAQSQQRGLSEPCASLELFNTLSELCTPLPLSRVMPLDRRWQKNNAYPRPISKARFLGSAAVRVPTPEQHVFGQLLARSFPMPPSSSQHSRYCRAVGLSKLVQGDELFSVAYGT